MSVEYERLAVLLEARVSDFEKKIAGATRNADRNFKKIESSADSMAKRIAGATSGIASRMAGAFAAGVSLRAAQQLVDSATRVQNALKVAGLEGKNLTSVYDRLFASAQKNAAPLEALTTLYGRMATAQKELGASQGDMLRFTDLVGLSIKASGQSAQEASGALLQLSQALGGGKVQAEEYNSLLDGARPLLQAVAAGMVEAGGSVSKLTALVKDGKVSSEAFFRAGLAGADTLQAAVASSEQTISQRFVRLQNVLVDAAGKFDKAAGASKNFGGAIDDLSSVIGSINWSNAVKQADSITGALSETLDAANGITREIGRKTGMDQFGVWLSDITGFDLATPEARGAKTYWDKWSEAQIKARSDALARVAKDPTQYGPQLPKPMQGPMPLGEQFGPEWPGRQEKISLKDYAVPDDKDGKSKKPKLDEYEREIAQIRERTSALQAVYAVQASLNPLVDDYGFATEKAAAAHDLLAAALKAGKADTPGLRSEIDAAADAYARATAEAEKLAESQSKVKETAKEIGDSISSVFKDVASAALEGKSIGKAFGKSIADAAVGGHFQMEVIFR